MDVDSFKLLLSPHGVDFVFIDGVCIKAHVPYSEENMTLKINPQIIYFFAGNEYGDTSKMHYEDTAESSEIFLEKGGEIKEFKGRTHTFSVCLLDVKQTKQDEMTFFTYIFRLEQL